jgi:hypothetical protein
VCVCVCVCVFACVCLGRKGVCLLLVVSLLLFVYGMILFECESVLRPTHSAAHRAPNLLLVQVGRHRNLTPQTLLADCNAELNFVRCWDKNLRESERLKHFF